MKKKFYLMGNLVYSFFIVTILLSCNACSKDDPVNTNEVSAETIQEINDLLAGLEKFNQPEETGTQLVSEEDPERNSDDPSQECVVKKYKAAPGFDEMILLDPTSDVIYPGAMLKGESIPTGEYIPINGGRAPITLSVSLSNLNGKPSTTIENPSLHTVREGVKDLLQQGVSGSTPAKVNFTTEEVYSAEQLNVALGASYTKGKNTVSGAFDFTSNEKNYRYVIKYLQVYYTIDLSLPANDNPGSLFTAVPNLNATSPVIVSSVKYGRMLLYTVETNSKYDETNAAFEAAFSGREVNGEGSYTNFWKNSTVKALIIGGSSGDAAKVVTGPEGVYSYITNGGEYSVDSPGAPLAYTLRYIRKDFPIANVVLSTEYNVRTCYEAYQKFHIELYGIKPVKKDLEYFLQIYGDMSIELYQGGKSKAKISWSHGADPALDLRKDQFYEITSKSPKEVELREPDLQNDYVKLHANFYESNGWFSPDHFGNSDIKLYIKDIPEIKDTNGDGKLTRADVSDQIVYLKDLPNGEFRAYFKVWRIY